MSSGLKRARLVGWVPGITRSVVPPTLVLQPGSQVRGRLES